MKKLFLEVIKKMFKNLLVTECFLSTIIVCIIKRHNDCILQFRCCVNSTKRVSVETNKWMHYHIVNSCQNF